jgi:chemotaxis response regulator CheB
MKVLVIYDDYVLKLMIGSVLNKAGIEYNFVKKDREAVQANIDYWQPDALIFDLGTRYNDLQNTLADEIYQQYHLPRVFFTNELNSSSVFNLQNDTAVIDTLYISSLPGIITRVLASS